MSARRLLIYGHAWRPTECTRSRYLGTVKSLVGGTHAPTAIRLLPFAPMYLDAYLVLAGSLSHISLPPAINLLIKQPSLLD